MTKAAKKITATRLVNRTRPALEPRAATQKSPITRRSVVRRDSAATRERILGVAMSEFSTHGYSGGRVDRISRKARVNVRMIYHYFGNKDALYLAVLERSYLSIREREQTLDVDGVDAIYGMRKLIELTFDFLATDPHFARLIIGENLMMGKMVQKSKIIPQMTRPLLLKLHSILKRGQEQNLFHRTIDAESLYISILGLCFIHVSNRHTLGTMFQRNFADQQWLKKRKAVVSDLLVSYLTRVDQDPTSIGHHRR